MAGPPSPCQMAALTHKRRVVNTQCTLRQRCLRYYASILSMIPSRPNRLHGRGTICSIPPCRRYYLTPTLENQTIHDFYLRSGINVTPPWRLPIYAGSTRNGASTVNDNAAPFSTSEGPGHDGSATAGTIKIWEASNATGQLLQTPPAVSFFIVGRNELAYLWYAGHQPGTLGGPKTAQ